jgi:hypothetical protein
MIKIRFILEKHMCNHHKVPPRINVHRREQRLCGGTDQCTQAGERRPERVHAASKGSENENPKVSLEETMVAIQKAQIGFQATLHVRNRMVQAYTDIMNMQV